jgi:hypothetical protein
MNILKRFGSGSQLYTFPTDSQVSYTDNFAITSDISGTVNVLSLIATPSATAGIAQGLFVQQANAAGTNQLDAAIRIDNADTNLLLTDAIFVSNKW